MGIKTKKKNNVKFAITIISVTIIIMIIMLFGSLYFIFKNDMRENSKNAQKYYNECAVTEEGIAEILTTIQGDLQMVPNEAIIALKGMNKANRIASNGINSITGLIDSNATLDITNVGNTLEVTKTMILVAQESAKEQKEISGKKNLKAQEVAKKIESLSKYITDSENETKEEKFAYLLNTELVSRFPYIESIADDETKLNGIIKFKRYSKQIENSEEVREYQLSYVTETKFEELYKKYENSGDKTIFKHFTINSEQNAVIAGGVETINTVTTNDFEITKETINEKSAETYIETGEPGTYQAKKYMINKQEIEYKSLTEQYVLPFNLLSALLIQTRDYNLVKDLAELVYDSEIVIGIYDNDTEIVRESTYTYSKLLEYTEATEMVFPSAEININNNKYEGVKQYCKGTITNDSNGEKEAIHTIYDGKTTQTTTEELHSIYVSQLTADGKISGTTENEENVFTTNHKVVVKSNETSTKSVILADVWVGKWITTYEPKEEIFPPSGIYEPVEIQNGETKEIQNTNFDGTVYKNSIEPVLTAHSNNLKEEVIKQIIEIEENAGTFDVEIEKVTAEVEKMSAEAIRKHAFGGSCIGENSCGLILSSYYQKKGIVLRDLIKESDSLSDKQLLSDVNTKEELKIVKEHVTKMIEENNIKNIENAQNENKKIEQKEEEEKNKKKEEFKKNLNDILSYNQMLIAQETNVKINYIEKNSKTSVVYEKNNTKTEDIGESFKKILNKARYHETRESLLTRSGWFWNIIEEYEDTAKIENLLRYLFNIAFNTNTFGTFSTEEIESLFSVFEPKKEMVPTTTSSFINLKKYIRTFENASMLDYIEGNTSYTSNLNKYITEDKQKYIIHTNEANRTEVGFGVDIADEGVEQALTLAGYSTEIGTEVSIELVDGLEQEKLKKAQTIVNNRTEELDLKLYQIYALVSRTYDCGEEIALDGIYTEQDLVEYYKKYFNSEVDDQYGKAENVDYSNELYSNYMCTPSKIDGKTDINLLKRRQDEWTLFQTGYMNNINEWCGVANYPEEIRTFKVGNYTFPEYPQTSKVGDTNLYAKERFGYPEANRTLGSSGCGIFSMAMILSGLLGDESIDPITLRDAMEQDSRIGYSYHAYDRATKKSNGSYAGVIADKDFLYDTYGVTSERHITYKEGIQAIKEGKALLAYEPGHYIAAVPVPDELQGEGYEFFIIDSARGHTGAYTSANDFKNKTGNDLSFLAIISL